MLSVSLSLASKVVAAPANHPSHIATASFNVKSVSSHRLISSCSSVHQKSSFPLFGTLRKNNTYPGCVGPHLPATSTQYHCLQRPSKLPNRSFTASQAKHSMHSTATCRAYVGESTPAAAEYHCNDFDWEELKQEAETLLADRHAQLKKHEDAASGQHRAVAASPALDPLPTQQQQANGTAEKWQYEKGCWEAFHARDNATARFYKERRYLLLEFPCLTVSQPPQHFLEIGCGCGSSLLPVLKANPTCSVTGSDLSPTAVHMFQQAAAKAGIAADRVTGCAADSTQAPNADAAPGSPPADAVLLIFTLAAVPPEEMPAMLRTAFQAVRPGGLLLIRDHGLYDLTHLRLPPEQQLADRLYRRLDGTTCYFFTTEDLRAQAEAVGFVTRECKYACTSLLNRKKQVHMKRVFVHGVFEKLATVAANSKIQ